jgi:hypothetical protein
MLIVLCQPLLSEAGIHFLGFKTLLSEIFRQNSYCIIFLIIPGGQQTPKGDKGLGNIMARS